MSAHRKEGGLSSIHNVLHAPVSCKDTATYSHKDNMMMELKFALKSKTRSQCTQPQKSQTPLIASFLLKKKKKK